MRQFWRVLYPILIYTTITMVVVLVSGEADSLINTLLAALAAVPVLGYLFWNEQRMRGKTLAAAGLSGGMTAYVILFGMTACIAANHLISISRLAIWFPGFSEVSEALYSPPLWLQIIAIGLVIPLAEELVFRGLGFARLRDGQGFWRAAILSSLIFGLYHGNVVQFVYAFILGLAMCWLYEITGSFLAPVLFHQAANLFSVVVTELAGEESGAFGMGISLYIRTLAAILLTLLVIREIKKADTRRN